MAAPSRKSVEAKTSPNPRKLSVWLASGDDQATPSPVLRQQQTLHAQWAEIERHDAEPVKWSRRRSLAFISLTCGGFWACVIIGVTRLAH
jgi:hypothetical protein